MKILLYVSDLIIPLVIFYIVGYGILMKKNVYEDFVTGAKDGLKTVVQILPTLVGLMVGVGILRASGFLDLLGDHRAVDQIYRFPVPAGASGHCSYVLLQCGNRIGA